jgi:hypothetical protein
VSERERGFSSPLPHGHSRLIQNHFASRIALFCLSFRIRRYGRFASSGSGPVACARVSFTRVKSKTSVAAGGGRWLRISCGSIKHRRTHFCLICCLSSAPQQTNQKACLSSRMLEVRARRFVIGAPQFTCFTGTNGQFLTPTYDTTCPYLRWLRITKSTRTMWRLCSGSIVLPFRYKYEDDVAAV